MNYTSVLHLHRIQTITAMNVTATKKKSLAMKMDELVKIGVLKQHTLEARIAEYKATYPEEFQADAIKEAEENHAKGLSCFEFSLNDGGVESVIQWGTPSNFIKNCYEWFIVNP
jgi:hypothetical protein